MRPGCPCLALERQKSPISNENALATLNRVREACPAVASVLIPDSIWQDYQAFALHSDGARHQPILVGAIKAGTLARITRPVHLFHIDSERPFKKAFLNALIDSWWIAPDEPARHERSRIFQGQLTEIMAAAELHRLGRQIESLDAWYDGPDITFVKEGTHTRVEVKHIGVSDDDFGSIRDENCGRPAGGSVDLAAARNYLVSRIYEAAIQLGKGKRDGRAVACIVVDELAWYPFSFSQLVRPEFLSQPAIEQRGTGTWPEHDAELRKRYTGYPEDVSVTIEALDDIWVLTRNSTLKLERKWQRGRSCPFSAKNIFERLNLRGWMYKIWARLYYRMNFSG